MYQIHFWDDGFKSELDEELLVIKSKSVKDVVKYLWKHEKEHIEKIMKGVKLSIWQHKRTLLWSEEWYDLDTKEEISIKDLQKLKQVQFKDGKMLPEDKRLYQQIDVKKLKSTQFYHLVLLMLEICDEYGVACLEFYEKIDDEWVDIKN